MRTLIYSLLLLTICIGSVYAELPKDIVFLATFDEGKGDALTDLSDHGNDGTAEGKASWIDGEFDKAFEFDGGTFITVENAAPLKELTDPMSVGAWVNPDGINNWQNIVEMDGGAGWKFGFHGSKNSSGLRIMSKIFSDKLRLLKANGVTSPQHGMAKRRLSISMVKKTTGVQSPGAGSLTSQENPVLILDIDGLLAHLISLVVWTNSGFPTR